MRSHRMSGTRFYRVWKDMKTRCLNTHYRLFKDYGGRGIGIAGAWMSFEGFKESLFDSYVAHVDEFGERNTFIERVDNQRGYEPGNVRWATRLEQNRNRRMQKLSPEKVNAIRELYEYGNGRILAYRFGVTPSVISEVVNQKRNYACK